MSHSTVLVIGPDPEEQLAPFSEDLEVEPYDEPCCCVRELADKRAHEATGLDRDSLREKFAKLPKDEKNDDMWQAMLSPLLAAEASECAKQISDLDCSNCYGTGLVKTTYNPQSKWDWYSLGGRWKGSFELKPGREGITGTPGAFNNEAPSDRHVDMAIKGDIDWAKMADWSTFAVLKNGKWYEKGNMGWFGIVVDAKNDDQWQEEFQSLLADLPDDTLLSVYDVHI